MLAIDLKNP